MFSDHSEIKLQNYQKMPKCFKIQQYTSKKNNHKEEKKQVKEEIMMELGFMN